MEQAEGNSSSQRQRQRTYSRFNENADLVGSGHTYKEVILDFVKRWIEENQVALLYVEQDCECVHMLSR